MSCRFFYFVFVVFFVSFLLFFFFFFFSSRRRHTRLVSDWSSDVCSSDLNGRERWACRTPLSTLGPGRITVRPLYHFPVLRDLVVDMAPFTARMRAVGAAFTPGDGERRDARISGDSAERQEIDEAIECIGCGLCVSGCTVVAPNARFPGPRALSRAFTLQRDSRDTARSTRWGVLLSDEALARCPRQANCTDVG